MGLGFSSRADTGISTVAMAPSFGAAAGLQATYSKPHQDVAANAQVQSVAGALKQSAVNGAAVTEQKQKISEQLGISQKSPAQNAGGALGLLGNVLQAAGAASPTLGAIGQAVSSVAALQGHEKSYFDAPAGGGKNQKYGYESEAAIARDAVHYSSFADEQGIGGGHAPAQAGPGPRGNPQRWDIAGQEDGMSGKKRADLEKQYAGLTNIEDGLAAQHGAAAAFAEKTWGIEIGDFKGGPKGPAAGADYSVAQSAPRPRAMAGMGMSL